MSIKHSLVLDGEMGELVKASRSLGKKIAVSEAKTMSALKSHSEAERRRRERINARLETLRELVPSNEKMDKATLLAEVINQVKQLKKAATQASEGLHIPMDTNELKVEKLYKNSNYEPFLLRASLCCDYRPELLSDLRQAINDLPIKLLKSEISTLKGRFKSVFLITTREEENINNDRELIVSSVHGALSRVLDKVSASAEFAEEMFFPRKRQRVSYFDSSSSSL
ncbi:hypothetical protein ACJIZ3_006230 [Penstemon smallii]|uniref:BHLH domain-containing protein n=1 Tax=Penstemon smallii TaxID=265156 RepID=A0ABD3S751_9LAMI